MTGHEVSRAARQEGIHPQALCWAIEVLLPVLRQLMQRSSGWRFWQRWGLQALVTALEQVQSSQCEVRL
jgi:hypothetical protein